MNPLEQELNELLVQAYRSIEQIEEQMLQASEHLNLTISEIHLLEAVGERRQDTEGKTIGEISECLGISPPSVTAAINKLVKKGYVEKKKSTVDGRLVHVTLTKEGHRANTAHRYFHTRMVRSVTSSLSREEQEPMLKGMRKLNCFFEQNLHKSEEKA